VAAVGGTAWWWGAHWVLRAEEDGPQARE